MVGRPYKNPRYLDNEEFTRLLIKMKTDGDQETWEKLCKMFNLIAERTLTRANFVRYSSDRKDDMRQEAVLDMMLGWTGFNPFHPKANAFSYFTQAVFNAGLKDIIANKKRESIFKVDNAIGLESLKEGFTGE